MTYFEAMVVKLSAALNQVCKLFPDLEKLKVFFGWASTDEIKTMLDKMTQHYCGVIHYPFCKHFKSQYPGANVPSLNEWVAADTFCNDTLAVDDGVPGHGGCAMLQIFCGLTSGTTHSYPMKSEKQVGQTFEDHICMVGTPVGLKSDNAKLELYGCTKDILCLHSLMMLNPSHTVSIKTKPNKRCKASSML